MDINIINRSNMQKTHRKNPKIRYDYSNNHPNSLVFRDLQSKMVVCINIEY